VNVTRYLKMNAPFAFGSSAVTIGLLGGYSAALILGTVCIVSVLAFKTELEEVLILAELHLDDRRRSEG
jgi:hypothetical protein